MTKSTFNHGSILGLRAGTAALAFLTLLFHGCATHVPQVSISRDPGPVRQTGSSATASAEVQIQAEHDQKDYSQSVQNQVNRTWKALLSSGAPAPGKGLFMIEFSVHRDGAVSDFRDLTAVAERPPGDVCERAIREAAPFPKWTPSMIEAFPYDYMKFRFTFYFDQP